MPRVSEQNAASKPCHLFDGQQYYANGFSDSKHYDNRNTKQQVIEKIWKFKEILDLVISKKVMVKAKGHSEKYIDCIKLS